MAKHTESRTLISDLSAHEGKTATIFGWVDKIRDLKNVVFIIIRDHTGKVQVTFDPADPKQSHLKSSVGALTPESTVRISARVTANPRVKLGGIELIPELLDTCSIATQPLPIDEKTTPAERADWRFLDLRSERNRLIFEVQTTVEHAMREFWVQQDFIEINTPKLMASASESGANVFKIKYFDGDAYLAQSPQFYKQMAMAAGFERVFEIGPVFRAEPSFTTRHTTEYTSVDMEMSWIQSHEDVMQFEEQWLVFVLQAVKKKHGDAIKKICKVDVIIPKLPFPKIPMKEAYAILKKLGHDVERDGDLDPEGERRLSQYVKEKMKHEFVFVTDYPVSVRPFYHMRSEQDPQATKSFDLLWKGVEITTGAQREHRYETLKKQALEKGLTEEGVRFYLDFFKYGVPPHGGFGFGLARMIVSLLELEGVREATYLFRGPNRLTP